jgi:ketosteroid isomerase-like protein
VNAQRRLLLQREAHPLGTAPGDSSVAAYVALLAPDARLYRDGMAPLAGRVAVEKFLGATPSRITWSPIDVRVSKAGDMAVSHGKFRSFGPDATSRAGHYVHLWLRDAAGRWRLAYDIATAE